MYLSVGANCHVACMQMSQCVTKVWISVWHDVQVSGWLFCILCVKCSWNVGNRNYNHPLFDRAWTRMCVCVCMSDRKWMNKCVLIVEPWRLSGRLIKESFIYAASAVARSLSLFLALALSQQNAASLQHPSITHMDAHKTANETGLMLEMHSSRAAAPHTTSCDRST